MVKVSEGEKRGVPFFASKDLRHLLLAEEFPMTALRWLTFLVVALMMLPGPGLSQTDPLRADPPEAVAASSEADERANQTPPVTEKPGSTSSARQAAIYRRPQRFLRDTMPPLAKPAPLRLGTFSREWARSGREALAKRRLLLWERVKATRNDLLSRREVFQPAGVRDETNSDSEVSER